MLDGIVCDRLNKITQPTLIICGEEDGLIPNPCLQGGRTQEVADIGTREIPNNKLVMVPDCGHFVQLEKPASTNQTILDFF